MNIVFGIIVGLVICNKSFVVQSLWVAFYRRRGKNGVRVLEFGIGLRRGLLHGLTKNQSSKKKDKDGQPLLDEKGKPIVKEKKMGAYSKIGVE